PLNGRLPRCIGLGGRAFFPFGLAPVSQSVADVRQFQRAKQTGRRAIPQEQRLRLAETADAGLVDPAACPDAMTSVSTLEQRGERPQPLGLMGSQQFGLAPLQFR